jgi:HKD family nuclease
MCPRSLVDTLLGCPSLLEVETALADGTERAFHPKSWLFEGASFAVAFVGSSNLSVSALGAGIEWNLRVERGIDPTA